MSGEVKEVKNRELILREGLRAIASLKPQTAARAAIGGMLGGVLGAVLFGRPAGAALGAALLAACGAYMGACEDNRVN